MKYRAILFSTILILPGLVAGCFNKQSASTKNTVIPAGQASQDEPIKYLEDIAPIELTRGVPKEVTVKVIRHEGMANELSVRVTTNIAGGPYAVPPPESTVAIEPDGPVQLTGDQTSATVVLTAGPETPLGKQTFVATLTGPEGFTIRSRFTVTVIEGTDQN